MRSFQVFEFGGPLREQARPVPVPRGTEVLLRVRACGVCHSDLHVQDGHFDLGDGQVLELARSVTLPRTLGHEIMGEILAAGPEAEGVTPGDRRLVFPWIGCGACPVCLGGAEHLCPRPASLGFNVDGGFSDHVIVPHPRYLVRVEGVPDHVACTFACSGLTAYSALRKAPRPADGDRVLVIGAGGVGLSAIRLAREVLGVAPVVAEIDLAKWDAARHAGASDVVTPSDGEARKALLKATGGFAAVFDFVGAQATVDYALGLVRKGGLVVVVGLIGGALSLPLPAFVMRGVALRGSFVGSLEELRALVDLAPTGWWRELPVTRRPLDEAGQALDDLRARRVVGRTVLSP